MIRFALAVVLALAGCAAPVSGQARPAEAPAVQNQEPPRRERPVIPEAPADWAVAALDPCALLRDAPVPGASALQPVPPDGCTLGFRAGNGELDAVEVYVGKEFGTVRRAVGLPTVVGSRVAYQSYFRPAPNAPAGVDARCYVNIPISATRVIMVGAPPLGGTVEASCADGRAVADSVAAKLNDPRSLARNPSPTSLPAPQKLGFEPNEPDDVRPSACAISDPIPESCRWPEPIAVPAGAAQILAAGQPGPTASDLNCAILREGATPVVGQIDLAADPSEPDGFCDALADGFRISLTFAPTSAQETFTSAHAKSCHAPEDPTEDVQAAGRRGVACLKGGEWAYRAAFPATGTNATDKGALRMTVVQLNRRGDSRVVEPYDLSRAREVTVAVAENVITRYLS